MSNKKLKFRKQIEKKRATRKKVLADRKQNREKSKERREQDMIQKQFQDVLVPYRKDTQHTGTTPYEPVDDPRKVEAVKKRLEHNMQIIEALEQEMLQEEDQRKKMQEEMQRAEAVAPDGQMKFIEGKIKEMIENES